MEVIIIEGSNEKNNIKMAKSIGIKTKINYEFKQSFIRDGKKLKKTSPYP